MSKMLSIADASGKISSVLEINGKLFPPFERPTENSPDPIEIIKTIPNLKLRNDDVLLVTYPKSGTHWIWEICDMLLHGCNTGECDTSMIESTPQTHLDKMSSPRILYTHLRLGDLPIDFLEKRPKLVYVQRNPKDVAVSLYHHMKRMNKNKVQPYDGDFKDFLELFIEGKVMYGSWFEYVLEWEKLMLNIGNVQVLSLTYEDVKENPIEQIRKLSKFLGVERDLEFIKMVSENCSFSEMEQRNGYRRISKLDNKSVFFRKGEVGDWKNWFTVAQNEWFDDIYLKKMITSTLHFRFSLI